MKPTAVDLLACPVCRHSLRLQGEGQSGEEILVGSLQCSSCHREYVVRDGIPRFVSDQEESGHVAQSFGFEWQTFHEGGFEPDTVFGRRIDEDVAQFYEVFGGSAQLDGARILDAGCGSGKLTAELAARHPTATVVGVDINPAIAEVYAASRRLPNLHIVHGSIFELPFPNGSFGIVWCNGVIHHTGNTRGAFDGLTRVVRAGGQLFVWVYQRKFSPLVALRMVLLPLGLTRWRHEFLYRLCQAISVPTWLAVQVLRVVNGTKVAQRHTHARILTRKRGYRELTLTWFDVLSPKFRDTYTEDELRSWFRDSNFDNLRAYWWPVGITGTRRSDHPRPTSR